MLADSQTDSYYSLIYLAPLLLTIAICYFEWRLLWKVHKSRDWCEMHPVMGTFFFLVLVAAGKAGLTQRRRPGT